MVRLISTSVAMVTYDVFISCLEVLVHILTLLLLDAPTGRTRVSRLNSCCRCSVLAPRALVRSCVGAKPEREHVTSQFRSQHSGPCVTQTV